MVEYFKRRENDVDAKAKTYRAKFLESGLVGYGSPDGKQEVIHLPDETIAKMADSFRGRPVIVDHESDITTENFADKAKGYVTGVQRYEDGWYCDFLLFNEGAIKDYEENGYKYVSCAYVETESEGGSTLHNIPYSEEVKDGYFTHLALTQTPRYEDARIFENSVSEEKRDNSKETENMFNIFKKESSGLDMDTLVETSKGAVSMAELIRTFEISAEEKPLENKAEESKEETKVEDKKEEKENSCGVEVKAEDEEKKEDDAEKENSAEEEKKNESEEEEKKEAEEKQNSVEFFNSLKNARENSSEDEKIISIPEDDFKRGSERY